MKKYLWMAALASVALASCVNEEVAEVAQVSQKKKLSFGAPVMYNQSRLNGEILGTEYPTDENFVVFGFEHEGNFAGWGVNEEYNSNDERFFPEEGVEVTNRTNTPYWDTPIDYYLPADHKFKLSFIAFSPTRTRNAYVDNQDNSKSTSISVENDGMTIKNWRMPDQPNLHYDLMTSELSANVTQPEVPIKFHHRLASINFQLSKPSTANTPYSVILKKLEIKDAGSSGELKNMGTYKDKLTGGANTSTSSEWSNLSSSNVPDSYLLFQGDKEIFKADAQNHANVTGMFLPIPQEVTANMIVCIDYTIQQQSGGDIDEGHKEIPFTSFIKSDNSITSKWEMGTRYIYHIHFGALTKIFFAPEIGSEWTTVNNAGAYTVERTNP